VIDQFLNPLRSRTWPRKLYGKFSIPLIFSISLLLHFIHNFETTNVFYQKRTGRGKALIRLMKKWSNFAWLWQFFFSSLMIFCCFSREFSENFPSLLVVPVSVSWLWWCTAAAAQNCLAGLASFAKIQDSRNF